MTLTFHALWMLCALGAAVFAAVPGLPPHGPRRRDLALMFAAFGATAVWLSTDRLADHVIIGIGAAMASGLLLTRRHTAGLSLVASGVLAGAWTSLLEAQGLPMAVAIAAAAVVPGITLRLAARRPAFITPVMRDDALIGMLVAGLFVAMLPGVLDGWRAAGNLSVPGDGVASAAMIPAWTLAMGAAALGSGALYALWSRR